MDLHALVQQVMGIFDVFSSNQDKWFFLSVKEEENCRFYSHCNIWKYQAESQGYVSWICNIFMILGNLSMFKRQIREEALCMKWMYLKIIAIFVEVKCSFSFNANSQGSKLRSKRLPKSGAWQVRDSASMPETENVTNVISIHTVLLEACSYFCVFK